MHTFLLVMEAILSIVIITVVMLQPSKTQGFGGGLIMGNTDRFYSKNKSRTYEAALSRITVVSAILFVIVTSALGLKL